MKMGVLETIGFCTLLYLSPKIISFVLSFFCRLFQKDRLIPEEDDYAIITGATNGIGLEYARQLARKGYNLLLLSRNEGKLMRVQAALQKEDVEVQYLIVDFTELDVYPKIRETIEALPGRVAVLVNNVGMMSEMPNMFTEQESESTNLETLICNTVSVTKMCEIVLPIMKEQQFGIVINISSAAAHTPLPLLSTYSATKAYVSTLSGCLAAEYQQYGIIIQDVVANHVNTNLSKNFNATMMTVEPRSFVSYALRTVGRERRTSAHPRHKMSKVIFGFLESIFPAGALWRAKLVTAYNIRAEAMKNK